MAPEIIEIDSKILAIVLRFGDVTDKLKFITPEYFPLQTGIHNREKGTYIEPHQHIDFEILKNFPCLESFYVEKGKVRVGIFNGKEKVKDVILNQGDSITLNSGHDIEFLEDTRLLEYKQGHYRGKENE